MLDVIYFGPIEWNYIKQRPQHIVCGLSRYGKVLYIEPLGLRNISFSDWPRIFTRAQSFLKKPKKTNTQENKNIFFLSPYYIPLYNNSPADKINKNILLQAVRKKLTENNFQHKPVLWFTAPISPALDLARELDHCLTVYECMDDYAEIHLLRGELESSRNIKAVEDKLTQKADLVIATSERLYHKLKEKNPTTYLVPNAVDFEFFSQKFKENLPLPSDLENIPRPVLGYFGTVGTWFDFELVEYVCKKRNWSVVLIGPVHVSYQNKLKNLHLLGTKSYAEIPNYLKYFDVCLIPFKINEVTRSINPLKVFEYLSSGKGVVSTYLPDLKPYRDIIHLVSSKEEFLECAELYLTAEQDEKIIQKRIETARLNSWEARTAKILSLLEENSKKLSKI